MTRPPSIAWGVRGRRAIGPLVFSGMAIGLANLSQSADLWIKALHVAAVISWMAGLLYLPRLFVYHCGVQVGSEASETFKVMEIKLLEFIMTPAMIVSWVLGLWLAWKVHGFVGGWLWAKLAMVAALTMSHGYLAAAARRFLNDGDRKTALHWRYVNEAPTVLMLAIVALVVVKPF